MEFAYTMCKKHNITSPKIISHLQIINNKMNICKTDNCSICGKIKKLIIYECFEHYFCLNCIYDKVYCEDKCAICEINANEL